MTEEEVLAMKAGEELSAIVAEQIMGECYHRHWDGDEDFIACVKCGEDRFYHQQSQAYSTDISAAWLVVNKMFGLGYAMSLLHLSSEFYPEYWYCDFRLKDSNKPPEYEWADHQMTAPAAICKAALLAKPGQGESDG